MSAEMPLAMTPVKTLRGICTHGISPVATPSEMTGRDDVELYNFDVVTGLGAMLLEQENIHQLGYVVNDGEPDMYLLKYVPERGVLVVQWNVTMTEHTDDHVTFMGEDQMDSIAWAFENVRMLMESDGGDGLIQGFGNPFQGL